MFVFFFLYYRQDLPQAALRVLFLLDHDPILGFFAPQGRHAAPIKVKFGRKERTVVPLLPAKFLLDRLRGGGLRPPKLKKLAFYQYNCTYGAGPLHDFFK